MALDLYAGSPVSDYEAAKPWYERLLGVEPSFIAHATEAVWELAEHRSLFIEEDAERAGGAIHTIFVDDLDARVADIASRGIEPDERITYPGRRERRSIATPTATRSVSEARSTQWDPDAEWAAVSLPMPRRISAPVRGNCSARRAEELAGPQGLGDPASG